MANKRGTLRLRPFSQYAKYEFATTNKWRVQIWNITETGYEAVFEDLIPVVSVTEPITAIAVEMRDIFNLSSVPINFNRSLSNYSLEIEFLDTNDYPVLKFLEGWVNSVFSGEKDKYHKGQLKFPSGNTDTASYSGFSGISTFKIPPLVRIIKLVSVYQGIWKDNYKYEISRVRDYFVIPTTDIQINWSNDSSLLQFNINFQVVGIRYRGSNESLGE